MRLATWNLDSDRASASMCERQRSRVELVAADVWVLTEAVVFAALPGHTVATSAAVPGSSSHFAVLTAERLRPVALPEAPTAAAGVATVADRQWLVVGVCLPWRRDAPPLPEASALGATTDVEHWRAAPERLAAGLTRLETEAPGLPLVLAGDLNQTPAGPVVGSRVGRALLVELLHRYGLTAHTASSPSARAGCTAIDHVCGPPPAAKVETWSNVDAQAGLLLTDHLGYVVVL